MYHMRTRSGILFLEEQTRSLVTRSLLAADSDLLKRSTKFNLASLSELTTLSANFTLMLIQK